MTDIKQLIAQHIKSAENELDIIISVHKKNVSNYSADPDEFDELYESALMNLVLLKQIEKQNFLNSKNE